MIFVSITNCSHHQLFLLIHKTFSFLFLGHWQQRKDATKSLLFATTPWNLVLRSTKWNMQNLLLDPMYVTYITKYRKFLLNSILQSVFCFFFWNFWNQQGENNQNSINKLRNEGRDWCTNEVEIDRNVLYN